MPEAEESRPQEPAAEPKSAKFRIHGNVPPEVWNRLGVKLLSKLRSGEGLQVGVEFVVTFRAEAAQSTEAELSQVLQDLGLQDKVRIERD